MKPDLVIDELVARQGEKSKGFVVVDTTASGTRVRVPIILINGAGPGPTLVVTSGIHGDDLNTIPMVWRVAETVDPVALRGQIIAIPICNPPAFEAGSHLSPGDNKSLSFPGNAHGTISERIGYHLFHKVVTQADYLVDMHGGSKTSTLAVLAGLFDGSPDTFDRAKAMAEVFNPDLIVFMRSKGGATPTGLFQAANLNGTPAIYTGMGQMGFNESDTVRGTKGVYNILYHLSMLDGEPELTVETKEAGVDVYQYSPYGGGFFPSVEAGDEVRRGQAVGVVRDVFGDLVGEVTSEVDGIVEAIRFYPVVGVGDWIVSTATWKSA